MVKFSEIALQNPWWKYGREFVEYDRHLAGAKPVFFKRKRIAVEPGNIYILRGPRQVGKTTYLKDIIEELIRNGVSERNILYLSADFFTSRREFRNALTYFIDSNRDASSVYLFLDEITYIEDWNLELKYLSDSGILKNGVVVATGSSAVRLKERSELLPGRGIEGNEFFIKPISFREFLLQSIDYITSHLEQDELIKGLRRLKEVAEETSIELSHKSQQIWKSVERVLPFKSELSYLFRIYLITGGFPGVINHYLVNRYLSSGKGIEPFVSEIFIRDVLGDMAKLQKQEVIARRLLGAILERYGSRYSFTKISKDIERNHITVIDYLEYLEEAFICFVLYSYDFNKKRPKWKGDKKVYFFDPFIFHAVKSYIRGEHVWDVITNTTEDEELQGKLVENLVISHLLMYKEIPFLKIGKTFLWFYYDRNGKEIDGIFKENDGYSGIEVKYRHQIQESWKCKEIFNKCFVLSRDETEIRDNLLLIPVDVFLLLLKVSDRNV